MNRLDKSFIFKGFKRVLLAEYGEDEARRIWNEASERLIAIERQQRFDADTRMMILPAVAIYQTCPDTLPLLKTYAETVGRKIGRMVHGLTSIPFVSRILWWRMPSLMRKMSGAEKGYKRQIVSETRELVGVDILVCPLHQAAIQLGAPEVASVVCTMDKAYMTGFKYIEYTRTKALGEGDSVCDYRLRFDKNKK